MQNSQMNVGQPTEQQATEIYRLLFDLWKAENPIKTSKLQVLLATNALLVSAFTLAGRSIWIAVAGAAFALVWTASIGRTEVYQRGWKNQMEQIRKLYPNNPMFQIHTKPPPRAVWGSIRSSYYLIGSPLVLAAAWMVVAIVKLLKVL